MQPLKQPQTAQELLELWDELVQNAAAENIERFRNQRDSFHNAAFTQGFGTGELDDMPEHREVWWASALRSYLTCRVSHEVDPHVETERQGLDEQAKQELMALKAQHKAEIEQHKASQKQQLAQLKEQHNDRRAQLCDRSDAALKRYEQAWGVYLCKEGGG